MWSYIAIAVLIGALAGLLAGAAAGVGGQHVKYINVTYYLPPETIVGAVAVFSFALATAMYIRYRRIGAVPWRFILFTTILLIGIAIIVYMTCTSLHRAVDEGTVPVVR